MILDDMKFILFSSVVLFSTVVSENCPPVSVRMKRSAERYKYPMTGIWFKDISSGRYYFKQGNSIYVQRYDGYYSKWVTSGGDYVLNDRYKWTWDREGRLYPMQDKSQHPVQKHQTFGIPIKCVDGPCPNQVRFPSGGEWHFTNCKYIYQIGYIIFELNSNGFYKKWSSKCGCVQICPDWWTWNPTNGEWMPVPNSQSTTCTRREAYGQPMRQKYVADAEIIKGPPQHAFEL